MGREQRRESRINHEIGIFAQVHTCAEKPELFGLSVPGEATDFSPHGLRFKSKLALPPGALINITIGIGKPLSVFLLLGEVCWEGKIDGHSTIGANLLNGEHSDMQRWVEAFDTNFIDDETLN